MNNEQRSETYRGIVARQFRRNTVAVFGFAVILGLFGAAIGSFLNVCIYRLPIHESIVFPVSHCRACSTPLAWYDNLPLLSYLLRRGRCRFC